MRRTRSAGQTGRFATARTPIRNRQSRRTCRRCEQPGRCAIDRVAAAGQLRNISSNRGASDGTAVFGWAWANVMADEEALGLVATGPVRGRHEMRTLHAHRSPLRSRQAFARARLAVLRAEVAAILRIFPELQAEMMRPPQRTVSRSGSSRDGCRHHPRYVDVRRTAH